MAFRKRELNHSGSQSLESKSASLAEADRRINFLEAENKQLKEELADVKSLYIQLTREASHEKFEERRVTLLKAQLIQLERQLLLLNDALGARMSVVLEAENALQMIADACRQCKNQEGRVGGYFIEKGELEGIIGTAESARLKLYKNLENTTMQRLHKPIQFMDHFVKHGECEKRTLLDICSGELNHINLKQVGKLESKLSQLYGQLQRVNHCLTAHLFPDEQDDRMDILPQANVIRMLGESSKACNMLNELMPDMLELSVLVPAAPWPMMSKPIVKELTIDHVMEKMPSMTKAKSQEVSAVVLNLLKVLSLIQLKANIQEKTYREEIRFHRSVYELQLDYIENLFKALRMAYEQFESETRELICGPLQKLLNIYQSLKKTAHEEALRKLLATLKENEPQMSEALAKLRKNEAFKGQDEALSSYAKEFFLKLDKMQQECQERRDLDIEEIHTVKEQQKEYWAEIRKMMLDKTEDDNDRDISSSFTTNSSKRKTKEKSPLHEYSWNSTTDITREETHDDMGLSERVAPCRRGSLPTPDSNVKEKSSKKEKSIANKKANSSQRTSEPNAQKESEALFKSILRGGIDDGPGFVFDSDATNERDASARNDSSPFDNFEYGQNTLSNRKEKDTSYQVRGDDNFSRKASKPPKGASGGKLMKGVGQSKLVLKPIPTNRGVRSRSATPENIHNDNWR